MSQLDLDLDLRKKIVLDLKKKNNLENQLASTVLVLDISTSMEELYRNGSVQRCTERLLPIGMGFDDNQSIEVYAFQNHCEKVGEVNRNGIVGYVDRKIYKKYDMGGTAYAPVINKIVEDYCTEPASGFGSIFKKRSKKSKLDYPVYVMFITDGDNNNSDKQPAREALIEASKYGIFFQFIGIGNADFNFLKQLDNLPGRTLDNANFFKQPDLNRVTDAELYEKMLVEFPSWIAQARSAGMIK